MYESGPRYIVRYVNLETGKFHETELSEVGIKYVKSISYIQIFQPLVRV